MIKTESEHSVLRPYESEIKSEFPSPPRTGVEASIRPCAPPETLDRLMSAIETPRQEVAAPCETKAERSGLPSYRFNFAGGIIR